jgi:hypothetical protein
LPTPETNALLAILEKNHPAWLCEHEALHEALLAYRHTDQELNAAYAVWLESLKGCDPDSVLQPAAESDARPVFERGTLWNGGGKWERVRWKVGSGFDMYQELADATDE